MKTIYQVLFLAVIGMGIGAALFKANLIDSDQRAAMQVRHQQQMTDEQAKAFSDHFTPIPTGY